jgi:hypothetical protein
MFPFQEIIIVEEYSKTKDVSLLQNFSEPFLSYSTALKWFVDEVAHISQE